MPTVLDPPALAVPASNLRKVTFDNREYLVEHPDQFQARTQQLLQRARSLGKVSVPNVQPHVAVSLAQYQTPIRDQKDRGACWAFAGVAGLEALYKRKYGISLDLSEQYVASMEKCGELYPDYVTNGVPHENNSSFWDAQGGSDIVEKLQRMAIPEEHFAPYQTQSQLDALRKSIPASGALDWNSTQEQLDAFEFSEANIPLAARQNAVYQATSWQSVGSPTIDALEKVLTAGHEVVVDLNLKWKFDSSKNAYDYDPDPNNKGGGHCTLLIGFDHTSQIFIIKNSWGGTAYLQVTYNFMQHCCSLGHYFTDVCDPKSPPQKLAYWIGNWNMDHDGWRGSLVIRRFTDFRNSNAAAPTKLGNYYRDGARHDVNGYFSDGGQAMVFWIADGANRIQPGTETGQSFQTYVFSWNPSNAAGRTTWQNIPFGVVLKRAALPSEPAAPFQLNNWIGNYAMDHDGWQGKLTVQSVNPFKAVYVDHTGKTLPVAGSVNSSRPHEMSLMIQFAGDNKQPFDLLHHTRERGIFAGTTVWGGHTYGVQGLLS